MIKQTCLTICILLMGWLMSCQEVDNRINPPGVVDGNKLEVSIKTSVPAITVQTRTTISTESERILQHVDVLVFEEMDGGEEKFAYRTNPVNDLSALDYTGNNVEIKVRLDLSRDDEKYRIVFIANLKNELDQLFENNDHIGELKDDLLENITFTRDDQWPADTPLPMWGEASQTTKIESTTTTVNFGTMNLVRSMARITIGVVMNGGNGMEKFEIKSVKVWNAHQTGLAVPYPDNFDGEKAIAPSLSEYTDRINKEKMKYEVSQEPNQISGIYINEASNQTDGQEKSDALFLILEAVYKGDNPNNTTPTYYKVGFYNGSNKPVDILRNYTYNMMITGVHGPGEEDEDSAANSDSNNLTVSMTDWSDGEMKHVVFNGQNFLAVSESTLEISRPADIHEILVQTNYSTGWKAEVIQGGSWITNLSPDTWTPPTNEPEPEKMRVPLSFNVLENETGADREGIIRLTCGGDHLSLDVKVLQSTKIVYTLRIMINNTDYPTQGDEFIEFDRVITFPSGYHYGNNEDITPRTLKIEWTPEDIPLILEFNPYFAWGDGTDTTSIHNTNGTTTFTVVPKKLSERSQEEWYPEAVGDIQIQIGDESTTQQNVLIRRRHHEVYIEKADRYVITGANDVHQFKLYSNTKWEAVSAAALSDSDEPGLILEKYEGDFNLTGEELGEDINFKLSPNLLSRSFAGTIPVNIRFMDADKQWFTKTYEFDIYHSTEDVNSGMKFGGKANCYVIHTNDNVGQKPYKVSIPVSQANESDWNSNEITSGLALDYKVIWIDNNNGYGQNNSTIQDITIDGDGPDARLIVTAGSKAGNAVIAVTSNGGQKIHWSWHIWVVDDVTFDPDDDDYDWPGFRYYRFMDRNLGALSADPSEATSRGLYYQWGRKDPFSVSGTDANTESNMYNSSGTLIPWALDRSGTSTNAQTSMDYSIANPGKFMSPTASTNWLSTSWTAGLGDDLWNEMENGSLSTSKKGVFDPCPDGWKTIPGGSNIQSEWYDLFGVVIYNSADNYSYAPGRDVGEWPHTGYINHNTGYRTATSEGRYWTGTNNEFSVAYHFRFQSTSRHPSESFNKSSGLPVRCMRRSETLKRE